MMPDDFEERLRAAMRRESDRLPFVVRIADVEHRLAEPSRRFPRWLAIAAVPLGTALVAAVLLAAPRPSPVATSRPSTGSCSVSPVTEHGSYSEAGGPKAFFGVGDYYANASWKIWVRWNPAPPASARLSMWATTAAGGNARVNAGQVDSGQPVSSVGGLPALPGAVSLAVQPLPSAGCWTLHAAIDGREVGSATINVATERVSLVAPSSCPITQRPNPPFVPPPSFLGTPLNGSGRAFYYGTNDLWTKVYADGSWGGARDASGGYGNKSFWWSDAFKVDKEPQPALQVTGRRLDGPAEAAHSDRATNAAASDIGSAMLTGVTLPTAGCWELTGHYRGHDLSYVVWVPEEPAVPTPGSPAPCATSGSPAGEGSPSAGQASFEIFPGQHPDSRGGAGVFVRVVPPTNAQTLLVTAFLLESRDRNVGGAISHALLDRYRRSSTGDAAGTRFRGSILLPGRGCWQLRAVLNGQALDGSAIVLHGDEPYRPAGVFQTEMSVRQMPCLGIAIDGPVGGQSAVPAWWWDAGSSGNCATRTSDLVATKATVRDDGSGYEVLFELPLLNGASDQIRLRLTTDGRDLIAAGDRGDVRFLRVEVVDPSFAPVSG